MTVDGRIALVAAFDLPSGVSMDDVARAFCQLHKDVPPCLFSIIATSTAPLPRRCTATPWP
ncbi:hypothetical protein EMIT053CA3_30271 [Pseudomonas donghuensis]